MDKPLSPSGWEAAARAHIAAWMAETSTEIAPRVIDWFLISRRATKEEIKAAFFETLMQMGYEQFNQQNSEHILVLRASNLSKESAEEEINLAQFAEAIGPYLLEVPVVEFFKALGPEIMDEKGQQKGAAAAALVSELNKHASPIPLQKLNKAWRGKP